VGALILAAPIFWSALKDLVRGEMHMDELVALAVLAAMSQGDFRTAGVVAFFMLLSLVIEARTAQGAHHAIESLIRLTPATARRIGPDGVERKSRPASCTPAIASACARAKTYPPTAPSAPAAPR
jgi:Cd2+/Zn2+-exporting ATPase